MSVLLFALALFTAGLMVSAALSDLAKLTIANIISILIAVCFFVAYGLNYAFGHDGIFQSLSSHLIAGGVMFAIMVGLFFMKLFGGGDAKIIPAISLWVGLDGLALFLMITSVGGGLLAIISIGLRKTRLGNLTLEKLSHHPKLKDGWFGALAQDKKIVPYGIAIAIGGVWTFRHLGYLP
jgi:prepilin peptidase CpaA